MIQDFWPIPEIGVRYKNKNGEVYVVEEILEDLGSLPDTVVAVMEDNSSIPSFEFHADDWNAQNFIKLGSSEPIPDPTPAPDSDPTQSPEPDQTPKPNPAPSPQQAPDSTTSDGIFSDDPKLNELAKLLEAGPKKLNEDFFPTDKTLSDNNMVEHDVEDAFQKTLDEIDALREKGELKSGGFPNEFLWTCGGLDKALLRMCPTDWAKKAGMGGTILGTAILAMFSGGFAFYTVFEHLGAAIIGGFIWGLVIFNLDRYLVNSMYSDGEPTISKQEFLSGLPRIIIAIFLGIVISTPIELKIFDGKINSYLSQEKATYIETCKNRDLADFNKEDSRLKTDYENAKKELSIVQKCMVAEEQGLIYNRSTGEITKDKLGNPLKNPRGAGNGDAYKELKNKEPILKQNADNLKIKYDSCHTKAENLISESKNNAESDYKDQIGLSKKLEAMSAITDTPTSCWYMPWTWSSLAIVRFFISLMFIILEILPVVNKMMQTDGEYDKLIDLESDTREKLTRTKAFNNINVLRSGNLSMYRNQIIYGKVPNKDTDGLVDEPDESSQAFMKTDFKKQNKNETDQDNFDIYRHARNIAKKYIMTRIDNLFEGTIAHDVDADFAKVEPKSSDDVTNKSNDADADMYKI